MVSSLDDATRKQLDRGARVTELLKQPQYSPLSISIMAVSLFAVNEGFFDEIDVKDVLKFESELHGFLKSSDEYSKLLERIESDQKLTEETEKKLKSALQEFTNSSK